MYLVIDHNLGQQLGEVWQILSEEAGLKYESLSGVRGSQLTTEEFGFASNAERGPSLRILQARQISSSFCLGNRTGDLP